MIRHSQWGVRPNIPCHRIKQNHPCLVKPDLTPHLRGKFLGFYGLRVKTDPRFSIVSGRSLKICPIDSVDGPPPNAHLL